MPLAERDVNSQHQLPLTRGKRLPAAGPATDENAAPSPTIPRAKMTPTHQQQHQRFYAPTKSSVAKNTPPPNGDRTRAQPLSGRSTPASRLPRRNAATPTPKPAFSPPMSKWNTSAVTGHPAYPASPAGAQWSSPSCGSLEDRSLIAHDALPRAAHRVRVEKPLPSRPIASLAYGPSPSRDSRCLIDASEKPLRQSYAGSERDWPTLMPSSSSTPILGSNQFDSIMADATLPSVRRSASATSLSEVATELPNDPITQRSDSNMKVSGSPEHRPASMSSSVSASDIDHARQHPDTFWSPRQNPAQQSKPGDSNTPAHPPRKSSLPNPPVDGGFLERSQSTSASVMTSPEFARDVFEASRPHSPSPASFSRPRPTSFSQSPEVASVPSVVEVTPVRSQKTASRIPLPDQKKATLVDIKSRRISSIPLPKFEKGLSFGGRRIDSPDPLKVLDHGIKRRQLKRANTGGSASTASTVPTRLLSDGTSPPIDRSKANTPDSTMGTTSDEEEEITTPSDKSVHYVKHGYKPEHVNTASGSHYAGATLKVYDEAEIVLGRPPPSNSPFTGPLQTIPSQSLLPLEALANRESLEVDPRPKVVIKPTEFSAFAQRLSVLEDSRALVNENPHDQESLIRGETKSELVDILREAEHEDALITQCGAKGLDDDTRMEITRTLSMLEGKCGPANTTVDLEHLARMFGRLKTGFEKAPKSAAFVEDATVAERFLARKESTATGVNGSTPAEEDIWHKLPHPTNRENDAASQLSRSKTVASKWSSSTTSAKDISTPYAEAAARRNTFGADFGNLPPGPPPKDFQDRTPTSIGYPSRTPGKAHRVLGTDERTVKSYKPTTRRVSSPTLGVRIPGSVRAAREKARDAAGSRANLRSSTKVEKMPTPNTKVFAVSDDPPRGRLPSAEKLGRSVPSKLPRSRSKSRYVLDKINGLFSGRRDRRTVEPPPVPPVKDNFIPTVPKEVRVNSAGSPVVTGSLAPPLTKMPTISPPVDSVHPALRSAPHSSSVASSAATIGSDADYEGRRSLQVLSEKLLGRAIKEGDPARKERLLNFAKVLNDSLISAREAQISAETAATAARSAQLSYEMTMKSVAMLQRLASSMNRR